MDDSYNDYSHGARKIVQRMFVDSLRHKLESTKGLRVRMMAQVHVEYREAKEAILVRCCSGRYVGSQKKQRMTSRIDQIVKDLLWLNMTVFCALTLKRILF